MQLAKYQLRQFGPTVALLFAALLLLLSSPLSNSRADETSNGYGAIGNDPSTAHHFGIVFVPPAVALPGAIPPIPEIYPYWQDKHLASFRPIDKPAIVVAAEEGERVIVDDFAETVIPEEPLAIDTLEQVAALEEEQPQLEETDTSAQIDEIETGSIPEQGQSSVPETAEPSQGDETASRAQEPDASGPQRGGEPEFDVTTEPQTETESQGLRLRAKLTTRLQTITRALDWTIYRAIGDDPALWPQVATIREAEPEITLDPGAYLVEVRYGFVTAAKSLNVTDGAITDATFVLNAGGLRILSQLVYVESPLIEPAIHFVYSSNPDENGMRELIARSDIQGEIIRLNAGDYHVISRLGNANSVVETSVEVHPGVLTAVEVNHKAGVLTMVAVEEQGDGNSDPVSIQVQDETGVIVAHIDGNMGHAVLAPGTYIVVAESGGRTDIQQLHIRIGEVVNLDLLPE